MEELYEEENWAPVSPTGQYLNSSVLSLTVVAVLEFQVPIHDLPTLSLLKTLFLPISPRFSSIMVGEKNGVKKWKKVEVNIQNHVKVPIYPSGKSLEYYEKYLGDYLSKICLEPLPDHQPLWEVHLLHFPTPNAAGNLIFKLHHALGDGYSLIGALLSCLKRADNPSLPLTFPSGRLSNYSKPQNDIKSMLKGVPQVSSWIVNSVRDFGWSVLKSSVLQDDLSPILSGDIGLEFHPMTISTMEFSMDHIKQIKTSLKVTLNDVITGVILLGTRVYMEGESKNSGNTSTNALVLLNTRNLEGYKSISEMVKPKASMPWGNHFAFLHLPLPKLSSTSNTTPAHVINPLEYVFATHNIIKRKKNNAAAFLIGGLLDHVRKIRGPEATASYIRKTMTNSSMGITNLIGPVEQMTLDHYPISGLYFAVAGVPQSVQVTVLSYVGKLRICIVVEKDFIDSDKFKACIKNAFDTMFKAAVPTQN